MATLSPYVITQAALPAAACVILPLERQDHDINKQAVRRYHPHH
jgi:hypothetical protein